jgi:hypothetical protein
MDSLVKNGETARQSGRLQLIPGRENTIKTDDVLQAKGRLHDAELATITRILNSDVSTGNTPAAASNINSDSVCCHGGVGMG